MDKLESSYRQDVAENASIFALTDISDESHAGLQMQDCWKRLSVVFTQVDTWHVKNLATIAVSFDLISYSSGLMSKRKWRQSWQTSSQSPSVELWKFETCMRARRRLRLSTVSYRHHLSKRWLWLSVYEKRRQLLVSRLRIFDIKSTWLKTTSALINKSSPKHRKIAASKRKRKQSKPNS